MIDGIKYHVRVIRRAPFIFNVTLNESSVDVWARKLGDGGFLLQVSGTKDSTAADWYAVTCYCTLWLISACASLIEPAAY